MSEQQPDDLVTALAEVICSGYGESGADEHDRAAARAVLARTDLVLPAADVIPRQAVLDVLTAHWGDHTGYVVLHASVLTALVAGGES
jgi:hypothetical protein